MTQQKVTSPAGDPDDGPKRHVWMETRSVSKSRCRTKYIVINFKAINQTQGGVDPLVNYFLFGVQRNEKGQ